MDHKERIARAAHADAQRNVTIAMARFGYQPPVRGPAVAAAPAPSVCAMAAEPAPFTGDQIAAATARIEAVAAAETRASWARAAALARGQHVVARPEKVVLADGWGQSIDRLNGATPAATSDKHGWRAAMRKRGVALKGDAEPATDSIKAGWKKAMAAATERLGR